ncbi:hypothetical protein ASG87_16285 [Frateuria sp. Soil773]|uniref:MgtC/SapB family protein n=1 Tax=Frateuria sp. Soil773 TaxID=1736407 RepID=UPI0006F8F475|nr:MgtC/SapB family protein [Frateuria sp. Soil773]KRE96550.1 hypothetical protein ASG87_16285 [Frateuria sp. Soil773]
MIDTWEILLRLLLAALLGGVIGLDRERREWAAGLRTHMLVCMGASLVIIVSAFGFADVLEQPHVVLDPSRIAAQVISGIGFLGAGTILFVQREQVVRGLTTAAGLWAVAAIGLAVGAGLYAAGALATLVAWAILAVLKPLQRRLFARRNGRPRLLLRIGGPQALASVEAVVTQQHLPLLKIVLRRREDGEDELSLLFDRRVRSEQLVALADALRAIDGLASIQLDATPRQA